MKKIKFKSEIKNKRKEYGFTLADVAREVGISQMTLSNYENNKSRCTPEMQGRIFTAINSLFFRLEELQIEVNQIAENIGKTPTNGKVCAGCSSVVEKSDEICMYCGTINENQNELE
jgi:DNA-binding XRE family transcriptional regulator